MDSTFMLYEALKVSDVYTCYIKANQHPAKAIMEIRVRKKLISMLEEMTGNKVLDDKVIDLGKSLFYLDHHDKAWGQAHVWLFGLIYVTRSDRHSKVCIGNVMGDDITMHLEDMQHAWNYTQKFAKSTWIPLEFPLAYKSKDTIIDQLPVELFPEMWICETPEGLWNSDEMDDQKPCGQCSACITMLQTIWRWEYLQKKDFKSWVLESIAENKKRRLASMGSNGRYVLGSHMSWCKYSEPNQKQSVLLKPFGNKNGKNNHS